MNYLFLFTIGPVQTFISQARKTQDLYAGSQILSELCRVCVDKVEEQYKGTIIFPNKGNAFLNRFMASIPVSETHLVKGIGQQIEQKAKNRLTEIAGEALILAKCPKPDGFDQQVDEHLDIYWAFYPIDNDYATAYRQLERLVGAIKNVRAFEQFNDGNGELGRKCSLDGDRNALFYRCNNVNKPPVYTSYNNGITFKKDDKNSKLRLNEGLSAMSFVKRHYQPPEQKVEFTSTPHIALMKYLQKIKSKEGGEYLVAKLMVEFGTRTLDYHIFYEENLTEKYFLENDLDTNKLPNIQEIIKEIETLHCESTKTKYYALMTFDGDKMGKWLAGYFIKDKGRLKEFHQALSKQLGEFAKYASECLIEPHGKTVYAGGDDFLGFVNLYALLKMMKQLRESFDCQVNQPLRNEFDCTKTFTFSAGVVIAHYKIPLNLVLARARALEKIAKTDGGRDAFAIAVMTNSGQSYEACCGWNRHSTEGGDIDRIRLLVEQLQENFSDTFIRNLNRELRLLIDEDERIKNDDMVNTEMKRMIRRALREGKPTTLADILSEELDQLLISVKKVTNFLEVLNIANFIRKETAPANSSTGT